MPTGILIGRLLSTAILVMVFVAEGACQPAGDATPALSDDQVENLVKRSFQYVAMYNVNNKFAAAQGGWNTIKADTQLKDHTLRDIARPNNDTFYSTCMLDLRHDPVVIDVPAYESEYVSLMVTGYDHYVNIPMATRLGDFERPERILLYSERTEDYSGEPVDGVDRIFETTGDFVSAVFRVMPHAAEPEKFARIKDQIRSIRLRTLSEYRGEAPKPIDDIEFPAVGQTDLDTYENNFLEVMQFVFNHTTFDPTNEDDQAVLEAFEPLGVEPGLPFDQSRLSRIDGRRFREAAADIRQYWLKAFSDEDFSRKFQPRIFQPKGQTDLEAVLAVSIVGPIGMPAEEAVYPQVTSSNGQPVNAMHDYVVRMSQDELPPANAFWSITLYDKEQGFFIPNDRKKYSVGLNGGMELDQDGGIAIYIAAERPDGVPEENWLPINREDTDLSVQLRLYEPDLEAMKTWVAPKAEQLDR